ncbi:DNA/RNA helicase, DEAD/DEAH box type, N-terminal [Artemisia annua]|uniref:DNA/RNA helicase, DEAD/DEAH box type, N-terminal n=1 Tax=Artemisia annua TaxID=35608 RepID=A0A2U1LZ10_ARTAN|nr:DNA/RNA helicase, DEAD/DEAH box type, N-terminal [Artemisia annua]
MLLMKLLFELPELPSQSQVALEKVLSRSMAGFFRRLEDDTVPFMPPCLQRETCYMPILNAIPQNQGFMHPVRTYFLEDVLEKIGHRLSAKNQIGDYGQDRAWELNKQYVNANLPRLMRQIIF